MGPAAPRGSVFTLAPAAELTALWTVGRTFTEQPTVRVTSGRGAPIPGVKVMWRAEGGGRTSAPTTSTDDLGEARVAWLLGHVPGRGCG